MTENTETRLPVDCDKLEEIENIKINVNLLNNNEVDDCEAADESITTDSEDYATPLRCTKLQFSTSSNDSDITVQANDNSQNNNATSKDSDNYSFNNFQIPIVGFEIMEERAKFTVFKLRIENKASGDSWYVFRRYTDFVRLCNKLKHSFPHIVRYLPRKRWLGNNFDTIFLEERANGLQTLVNAILNESELMNTTLIQDFFCLNEPPVYSESNEESRAMFEALEDTIYQLKQQIMEKEKIIDHLEEELHGKSIENDNLKKLILNSSVHCTKCDKECKNVTNVFNGQ